MNTLLENILESETNKTSHSFKKTMLISIKLTTRTQKSIDKLIKTCFALPGLR